MTEGKSAQGGTRTSSGTHPGRSRRATVPSKSGPSNAKRRITSSGEPSGRSNVAPEGLVPVRAAAKRLGRSVAELMLEAESGPLVIRQRMAGLFIDPIDLDFYQRATAQ